MGSSVLEEAMRVLEQREAHYGPCEQNFADIAHTWEVVFGHAVTGHQVALCFILTKVCRETFEHDRDNFRDIDGYAECGERVWNWEHRDVPMEEEGCATVGGEDCREAGAEGVNPSVRGRKARGHH